jgi:hypothetical protein
MATYHKQIYPDLAPVPIPTSVPRVGKGKRVIGRAKLPASIHNSDSDSGTAEESDGEEEHHTSQGEASDGSDVDEDLQELDPSAIKSKMASEVVSSYIHVKYI